MAHHACATELPILHLRKSPSPLPLVSKLDNVTYASAWYGCSPTWFGNGGARPGTRNHTEVLASYDDTALYIAFLNIDRSTHVYPQGSDTDLTTVDANAIWIQTPSGRRYWFMATVDDRYPPQPKRSSGEWPAFDGKVDLLTGWSSKGWFAGNLTLQQTIVIPWSTLGTEAPAPGSRWRANFLNYNQTSSERTPATVNIQQWASGTQAEPDMWGYLAFDEAAPPPTPDVSPEATITLRPATGYGGEATLSPGDYADSPNRWPNEAVTQSNWNDWDPIQYTIKEFVQFDISVIPRGRKIISAVFRSYDRGHFNDSPTDQYLHVVRLDGSYDPRMVTFATSPLPMENGFRRLVRNAEDGTWIDWDVTDVVRRAYDDGRTKASFALAGSSGDTHNGKIWGTSFGRADYYDGQRPRLIITFGEPGVSYTSPLNLGSGNHTSIATSAHKNKLTNGTFRFGAFEGVVNTSYWQDPGQAYTDGRNVILLQREGDVNPQTGLPAARFYCPVAWKYIKQTTNAVVPGRTYVLSGWFRGSAPGIQADMRLTPRDAAGNSLGTVQKTYTGSGNWEQIKVTKTMPAGTVSADVYIYTNTASTDGYVLLSGFQLEEGSTPTAYSETMGIYYPDHPRTDGVRTGNPEIMLTLSTNKATAFSGDRVRYEITYRNDGSREATNVTIMCPLPTGMTYVIASATEGGTYDPGTRTVRWQIGSVPPGNSGMVTFETVVD